MADLRVTNLVVEYAAGGEKIRPIDGIDLKVQAGSLAVLLGPSGCGKTTLLSCLGGILSPTEGRIEFGDVEVTALDRRGLSDYRRRSVGIVFQAFNLVASLTALENVMVPLWAAGFSRHAAAERATELLTRFGLQDRLTHRPGDLSGGQQQRVAVARAIALDPPLILADEPTAHLDFVQMEEVLRLIRELASGDRIVVVATHDTRILPLADQVVRLASPLVTTEQAPETLDLARGSVLFQQGSIGDMIYEVRDGELEIVRAVAGRGEKLLKIATRGDYVGEIEPLYRMARSATARARSDATVVAYTVPAFRERLMASADGHVVDYHELDVKPRGRKPGWRPLLRRRSLSR